MEITKLSLQTKNPNRVNVFVDGKFYRGLDKLVAMQMGLRVGLTLGPALIKQMEKSAVSSDAWEYALRSLQFSAKSQKRLEKKLAERFEPSVVAQTIEKLKANQILDDQRLANALVTKQMEQGTKSKRHIALWLRTKELPQDVVQQALNQIDENYEKRAARNVIGKKIRPTSPAENSHKFRQKLTAHLSQRGFNYSTVREVLDEVLYVDS